MKLLLLIFVQVLSAAEMSFSPIFSHYLRSNGYITPSDDIQSLLESPSKHGFSKELVQIVTEAQENTLLIVPLDSKNPPTYEYNSDTADRSCFQSVLEKVNRIQYSQILFKQKHDSVESNLYLYSLSRMAKDFAFFLSIRPYKNNALHIVLKSLNGKISKLFNEFIELYPKVPLYSKSIMSAYKAHNLYAPSLPPVDVKWAKANDSAEPKAQYLLLSEELRSKAISFKYYASFKDSFYQNYQRFIRNKGEDYELHDLKTGSGPPLIVKHKELGRSIGNAWLAFWFLGMRIRRLMPSPSEKAIGPCLIESFNIEIKAMDEVVIEDEKTRKYALKCSCLHIDYLIACIQTALIYELLNHRDHAICIDLLLTHRKKALNMIDNLVRNVILSEVGKTKLDGYYFGRIESSSLASENSCYVKFNKYLF